MSHYTMPYKYGKRTREFLGAFLFPFQSSFPRFSGVFNKTIIPLALVGYEMIIANSALRASLAIYHLISNKREWNNCKIIIHQIFSLARDWSKRVTIWRIIKTIASIWGENMLGYLSLDIICSS